MVIAFVLTATGCGKSYIEPEFMPYVQTFEDATGKPVNLTIRFIKQFNNDNIKAKCWDRVFTRDIEVSEKHWSGMSPSLKEALILHELGHCVLNRGHIKWEDKINAPYNNCPNSVMDPNSVPDWCYEQNRRHYLEEISRI
jgi:hypothetical protein